jgi:predicted metal-binding membrane protein
MSAAVVTGRRPWRPSPLFLGLAAAIVVGWGISAWAEASGASAQLHHHALYHGTSGVWVAVLLVMASWQSMTAAMMLPSSVPFTVLFARTARRAPRYRLTITLFLLAYFAVWTVFAAEAFLADWLLHTVVHGSAWLTAHDQVIAAGTLGLAAAYQLSPLKDACLRTCRNPGAYLLRFYRRGPLAGARLGLEHGMFCLGCCWALMLVMFAVGMAHLAWMGVLAIVMLVEKAAPWGERVVVPVAACLGLLAVAALAVPGSVPGL